MGHWAIWPLCIRVIGHNSRLALAIGIKSQDGLQQERGHVADLSGMALQLASSLRMDCNCNVEGFV